MSDIVTSKDVEHYFKQIEKEVDHAYDKANNARKKGIDPETKVDIPLAKNMAERVEGLISDRAPQILGSGIIKRINQLEKEYGILDWRVGFKIAEEVAKEKFCKFKDKKEAMEIGIRVGFAYLTIGIVSAPLEGFVELRIKPRADGQGEYFSIFYSGPIRGAGGTAAATSVILADYVRVKMGYAKYDPTEQEIKRYVTEIQDYQERVTNLQYFPSPAEIEFMVSHVPVEVNGDPTEQLEVSNYKDIPRVETPRIRGGVCLVIGEGLCQKSPKIWKRISKWGKDFGIEWDFLGEFLEMQKKIKAKSQSTSQKDDKKKISPNYTFINDLVAGRHILTHPMREGGFRLRYGRTRTSGFSAAAIHPATMQLLNGYIAVATQLKVERPGKAAAMTVCDTIETPVVKLDDGCVIKLRDEQHAKELTDRVTQILFLGDILFNYGDFSENGHILVPPGYCEEWWVQELEKATVNLFGSLDIEKLAELVEIPSEDIDKLIKKPATKLSSSVAIKIAEKTNTPLHPIYTYFFNSIKPPELLRLLKELMKSTIDFEDNTIKKIVMRNNDEIKLILEKICIPHLLVNKEFIVIEKHEATALAYALALHKDNNPEELEKFIKENPSLTSFEIINQFFKIKLRDKGGTYIGARMGRPEKAKMRKLTGSPHALFPVGDNGGRLRSFQSAIESKKVKGEFPIYRCGKCEKNTIYRICEDCGKPAKRMYYCKVCGVVEKEDCEKHGKAASFTTQEIDIGHYFNSAVKKLNIKAVPDLIKGVRGTSNKDHTPEHLGKAILRAYNDIFVNKDGTTRYDMSEIPITHFKPSEIGTSIDKLKAMGYTKDIKSKELTSDDQVIEIFPQDIILPSPECTLDETADDSLIKVTKFIDDELTLLYDQEPYYNVKTREDIVGHLVVGLAPHISAGLIGRIIGFSKVNGCFAHPLWHAGLRRDCVHPKTRFVFSDGSVKIDNIGDYVEGLIRSGSKTKSIDSFGTIKVECKKELYAFGVDPDTKLFKKKKIKYFIKGPKPKHWVKVITASNREFVMTPTHNFMYVDDDSVFRLKKAKKVNIGDRIPLLNNFCTQTTFRDDINLISLLIKDLPIEELKKIYLVNKDFFKALKERIGRDKLVRIIDKPNCYKNLNKWFRKVPLDDIKKLVEMKLVTEEELAKNTRIRVWHHFITYPTRIKINAELASLLGYYSAEGYCRQNNTVSQVSFRICNKALQKKIIGLAHSIFGLKVNLGEEDTKITICSRLIYCLFKYCFDTGNNAYNKKVPNLIHNVSDNIALSYVSAFLDGDGGVIKENESVVFYSVNRKLLDDIAFVLTRFNVFSKYHKTKLRMPGKTVLDIYSRLNKAPKAHILYHLVINGKDTNKLKLLLSLTEKNKRYKLESLKIKDGARRTSFLGKQYLLEDEGDIIIDYVKEVEIIKDNKHSYCLEIEWDSDGDKNILWGEQILNTRCDGDEIGVMMLMDALLNFSRQYLPDKRGSRSMDSPLVLTSILNPAEVDDQAQGIDVQWKYPLEFYEAALNYAPPWEIKIEQLRHRIGTVLQYEDFGFTHSVTNFNAGVTLSAYKTLPSMEEKLKGQMEIAVKIRAVDESDVARMVIEKHFLKDTKGNLRKFSMQEFRCVACNEKFRRPPLVGKCTKCGGKILFTISEGSVVKYLEPSISLAKKYDVPDYLKQSLELLKRRIEDVFGKEKEKQEGLGKWFG